MHFSNLLCNGQLQNKLLMERAMIGGSKSWNRCKIMLVGEGRVGKTALCNSMMGNRLSR